MSKRIKFLTLPVLATLFVVIGVANAPAQPKPDYIINEITIAPTNPDSDDIITITAVVRNNGDDTALASVLDINLDSETNPTTYTVPGLLKHTNFTQNRIVGLLAPGSHSVTATADSTNILDEKKEDNNALTLNFNVTAGPPDLIVESLSYLPPTPVTGDLVTITAIVKNQGDQDAAASILEILLSNESEPSTHTIPLLAPNATYQVERGVIFDQIGVYDVTATADANDDVAESNEGNNVATDSITVESAEGPDLIVTIDHDPADPTIDDTLNVTAAVENAGNDAAGTSTLEIDFGGLNGIETYEIPPLDPGEIYQIDSQFVNPLPGNYQVSATADLYDDVDESREYNNIDSDDIHVSAPDLVVSSLDHTPANPDIVDEVTITAIVENIGDATASTSTLELDVNGDVETYEIPALAPAETYQVDRQIVLGAPGSYTVNATADLYNDVNESNETNNTAMDTIDVSDMPDLIVSSLDHSPDNPFINDIITLTAVVQNIGGTAATTSTLELDVEGEAGPVTFTIPALLPDESSQVQMQVIKSAPGTYEVTATADFDDDNEESNEDNNISLYSFSVRGTGPDLIISSLVYEPAMPFADQPTTITALIENAGNAGATSSTLWILVGAAIMPETFEIKPLAPAEIIQAQLIMIPPDPGTYAITATADAEDVVMESDETNNDEIIDIDVFNSDAAKLRRYLLGILALTEEEKPFYDINQDGVVDVADLITLLIL
ncbi:hypothetical protein JW926_06165 [Candidatus Sumerlaeota bacterium]|nr:hypothetical protein [Candidatus Sumerlaeota bacterium]